MNRKVVNQASRKAVSSSLIKRFCDFIEDHMPPTPREIEKYYFTISEAADMLKLSHQTVSNMCVDKRLKGVKHPGPTTYGVQVQWHIRPGSITKYLESQCGK
jgi:hypothetical protein